MADAVERIHVSRAVSARRAWRILEVRRTARVSRHTVATGERAGAQAELRCASVGAKTRSVERGSMQIKLDGGSPVMKRYKTLASCCMAVACMAALLAVLTGCSSQQSYTPPRESGHAGIAGNRQRRHAARRREHRQPAAGGARPPRRPRSSASTWTWRRRSPTASA